MKYVEEYRDAAAAQRFADAIRAMTTRPWNIMEICGGQTHAIVRFGLDQMLPPEINLIHGPGCPVCVTPIEQIDKAVAIAARPGVIFCSFGDMLRVPGSHKDLLTVKSEGGDVRIVYSPMDAVALARKHPEREVVFFAIGFETTAAPNAMAVAQARRLGLANFSVLVSQVMVPPAMRAVLARRPTGCRAFWPPATSAPSWASTTTTPSPGSTACRSSSPGSSRWTSSREFACASSSSKKAGRKSRTSTAARVRPEGNLAAIRQIEEVFRVGPRKWRGIGAIPESGLGCASITLRSAPKPASA